LVDDGEDIFVAAGFSDGYVRYFDIKSNFSVGEHFLGKESK
jgi:hypothetical protein